MVKLFLAFLLFSFFLSPEVASGQNIDYPFKSGEYARYGAYYNWHFIWLQSGEVEFRADTIQYKKQKAWHLKAVGKTFKAYDLLYSVRDTFEVFSNYDSFKPLYSRRALNHAKMNSVHEYSFDYGTGKIETRIRQEGKPLYSGKISVQENTYDLLATAYHFRKFDFNKLFVGQKVPYRMLIDRQVADLYFRYLGKENVKTRNGNEYRCHKVSVYLLQGDFFPEGEYMKVWFTDDKNHLPVQVESEIQVGSVKALLLDSKSLKYPLSSLKK
ncbi:MAG: DUF3108 domain-containing protein [Bacteroidota bacterium]|nr:DUF3108 domain-containing protein [Bacteroidota bacterium]